MSCIALASFLLSCAAALTVGEGYVRFPQNQNDAKPEFLFAKRYRQTNVVWYGHFQVPGHLALNNPARHNFRTHDVLVSSGSKSLMGFKVQGKLTIKGSSYPGTYHDCELTGKIKDIQLRGIRLRSSVRFPFIEFSRGVIKSPNLQCKSSNAAVRNYIMNTGNELLTNLHFQNSGVALPSFILKNAESIFIHQHLYQHFFAHELKKFNFKLTILSVDGIYSGEVQKMSVSTTDENPGTVSVTGDLKYTTRLWIRVAGRVQWYNRSFDIKGAATLLNANAAVIAEHKRTFFYSSLRSNAVIKPRSFIIRGQLKQNSVHLYCQHEGARLLTRSYFVDILKRKGIAFTDTS